MTKRLLVLAAAFALAAPAFGASGDPEAGRKKSVPCQACHGETGVSASPEFPNLAGQHPDYIVAALRHYQNGKRKNPIMAAQVNNPSAKMTERDMHDLAAFFSRQQGLVVKW